MRVLVLGGTVFVSRTMAETAVAAGHEVVTFNRGLSGVEPSGVTALHGDRGHAEDLQQLAGQRFDLVFDTAYDPALARASAELLEPTAGHYAFVSSINAFPGWPEQVDYRNGGEWDGDPDASDEVPDGVGDEGAYGWRKVSAERAIRRVFSDSRTTVLRAGCIVGPYDGIGRLPWWLDRVARGGRMLVPGDPRDTMAIIDARDLAEFALKRPGGTFEVTGPPGQLTRAEFISSAAAVTGSAPDPVWAPDGFLAGKVEGWTEVPLWVPAAEAPGLFRHNPDEAEASGLTWRPVHETMSTTWRWMSSLPEPWQPSERTPGLVPDREAELLAELDGWLSSAGAAPAPGS